MVEESSRQGEQPLQSPEEHAEPAGDLRRVCLPLLLALTGPDRSPMRWTGTSPHREASEGSPQYIHPGVLWKASQGGCAGSLCWENAAPPALDCLLSRDFVRIKSSRALQKKKGSLSNVCVKPKGSSLVLLSVS